MTNTNSVDKSKTEIKLEGETNDIVFRLTERKRLMDAAAGPGLSDGAGVVLQFRGTEVSKEELLLTETAKEPTDADVNEAVRYRLSVTDLFVEKAQYHLERRADLYEKIGYGMYIIAVVILAIGAGIAVSRMLTDTDRESELAVVAAVVPQQAAAVAPQESADTDSAQGWIDLLRGFILSFTGYGFIVLTAVALARGARACLDQRERLLAKRHSLRQGRLYLHLTGGNVTIEEIERAFNWNHEQHNAFTHLPTDTKAPWGSVIEQVVKVTPELVKTGVAVAQDAAKKGPRGGEDKSK